MPTISQRRGDALSRARKRPPCIGAVVPWLVSASGSAIAGLCTLGRWLALAGVLSLLLTACKPDAPKKEEPVTVGITGYNFTNEGVQRYFVNNTYGSNLPPYGGGGATSCCVSLPAKWSPELKIELTWRMGDWTVPYEQIAHLSTDEQLKCCWKVRALAKTVSVEPYQADTMGSLQVFFLPEDEIKVWVYLAGPQNPGHPSRMGYPAPSAPSHSGEPTNDR
ncbi:hypothetical protein DBV14_17550 [Variovorax sp. KBW07]|uniref:DUF3304 domain-containing protein n=1 Tax=Variovorax sp. KBW07 TaxID=2153358 RepID=UPI000F57E1DD|nr:DUF3304 domain-containing protein [Variovorax sp. KBW07]RQO50977.1 hypothetical protein DBV14_17550 [Variovorax sp. KBW07]